MVKEMGPELKDGHYRKKQWKFKNVLSIFKKCMYEPSKISRNSLSLLVPREIFGYILRVDEEGENMLQNGWSAWVVHLNS